MTAHTDPWFKFYPSDWRADPALRMCSGGARALWLEMLCLMHEADPRGQLLVRGRVPTARQLGVLAGLAERDTAAWLAELESAEVFSRTEEGTPYSRKMVRDTAKGNEQRAKVEKRWAKVRGTSSGNTGLHTEPDTETLPQIPEARSQNVRRLLVEINKPVLSGQAARGTRLAVNWLPEGEYVVFASREGFSPPAILKMGEDFRDYWTAQPGQKGVKLDWLATWRRWVREQAKRDATKRPAPKRVGFV